MTHIRWKWRAMLGFILAAMLGVGVASDALAARSAGIIYAAPSAQGPVLQLLSRDYQIDALATLPPSFTLAPVVIGPAALESPATMAMVIRAYQAGEPVGIVQATQAQTNQFDGLVENDPVASCEPAEGSSTIAFYGLRRVFRQPPEDSRNCLPYVVSKAGPAQKTERQWLDERFASTPAPLPETTSLGSLPNLDDLSAKVHCGELETGPFGSVQQDIYLTSLRSFSQSQDYILINSYPKFRPAPGAYVHTFYANFSQPYPANGDLSDLTGSRIVFSEPGTTSAYVSQYTNSQSETVTGGGGFSVGTEFTFDVEASYSITVGREATVSVPAIKIRNSTNLLGGGASWEFSPANPEQALYSFATSHLVRIPRSVYENVYPDGEPKGELLIPYLAVLGNVLEHGQCGFHAPFPTWTVTNPEISEVDPARVSRGGGTFVIVGNQMYPSIVSDVLLGGDPLPSGNVVPLDDSHIEVTVPSNVKVGLQPVQVNTIFNGSILPSNTNVEVEIRPNG